MIELTRACARSASVLIVNAVLETSDVYAPDCRIYRFESGKPSGEAWLYDDFKFHMQDIALFRNPEIDPSTDYLTYMSSEGDVFHAWWKGNFQEKIAGAGTWVQDTKFYGRLMGLSQIGERLYACGAGGQIYVRQGRNDWRMLTNAVLFDPQKYDEMRKIRPATDDPAYLNWLLETNKHSPRNLLFNDIKGMAEDNIYLCGEDGIKPLLCHWDGKQLEELNLHLPEAALTGLYVESADSVWVCGREGVILHGSRARGFTPVGANTRLNLFHHITPYRGKLVLPASVRPGGLYELDPKTGAFGRFDPPLPRLKQPGGPFFAEAVGDVLWVVAPKDIFRFDGKAWERIKHPDMP